MKRRNSLRTTHLYVRPHCVYLGVIVHGLQAVFEEQNTNKVCGIACIDVSCPFFLNYVPTEKGGGAEVEGIGCEIQEAQYEIGLCSLSRYRVLRRHVLLVVVCSCLTRRSVFFHTMCHLLSCLCPMVGLYVFSHVIMLRRPCKRVIL